MKLFPSDTLEKLEFDKINTILLKNCLSELGRNEIEKSVFETDLLVLQKKMRKVFEMKMAFENGIHFPAQNYISLEKELKYIEIENYTLEGKSFRKILNFLMTIEEIFFFFEKHPEEYKTLKEVLNPIALDKSIAIEIDKIIDEEGGVRSDASAELVSIRRRMNGKHKELTQVFNKVIAKLKSKGILAESEESVRNNRRVLSVHSANKRSIDGMILDESESGKTTYIEPQQTLLLNNELFELESQERREIIKILKVLTAKVAQNKYVIQDYSKVLAKFDAIRSKALLAVSLEANMPILVQENVLEIKEAYHPILFLHNKNLSKKSIPLDIKITKKHHLVLISGPNAGGKSIALKTVGLLQLMLQFGLMIPCAENSKFRIFHNLYTDLGDNQSIEDELSTYSSRLNRMKYFMKNSNSKTLYLIDEFGTGTDPRFGAAMSEAILNKLIQTKAFGVITTHYSNLKKIGEAHPNIENAAMLFDEKNFKPKYILKLGKPGSSYTFAIAEKIGLDSNLITEAKSLVDYSDLKFDELLMQVESERKRFENSNTTIKKEHTKLKKLMLKFDKLNEDLEFQRTILLEKQVSLEQEKTEQIEKQARQFLNKINKAKSKEKVAKKIQKSSAERKQVLISKKTKLLKITDRIIIQDNIKVGDIVSLKDSEKEGEVVEIRKNKALVNINGMKFTLSLKDLVKIKKEKNEQVASYTKVVKIKEVENVFDLRGLMKMDAILQVEQYFDQALLNNLESIKLIHGKGSGTLRNVVKALVREYKSNIREWKYEEDHKGGDGATIITFK